MESTTLVVSSHALEFLRKHSSLPRELGGSAARTDRFSAADTADRLSASLMNWRGVSGEGYLTANETSSFRGLAIRDQLYVNHLRDSASHALTDEERLVDEATARDPEDRVFAGDVVTDPIYYGSSAEMRALLKDEYVLQQAYLRDQRGGEYTRERDLATRAERLFPGAERVAWLREGELSRVLVENRGGIVERLNSEETLRQIIETVPQKVLVAESREEVLESLLPELENSDVVLTERFLQSHPMIALELLRNPGKRSWVEEDLDNARSMVTDANVLEAEFRERVQQRAAELIRTFPFSNATFAEAVDLDEIQDQYDAGKDPAKLVEWIEHHPDLAEVVVADTVTDRPYKLASWLEAQDDVSLTEAYASDLIHQYWVYRASEEDGGLIPDQVFQESSALAMLIASDRILRENLREEAGLLAKSFPSEAAFERILAVYQGYGLGLGDRNFGDDRGFNLVV